MEQGSTVTQIQLAGVASVQPLGLFLTWWTVLIEGSLAIAFLVPSTRHTIFVRSLLLLAFLITTYTNAPVIGFGWLLAVMGLAQCEPRARGMQFAFVIAFLLIWLYNMPLSDLSYGLFQVRLPFAR